MNRDNLLPPEYEWGIAPERPHRVEPVRAVCGGAFHVRRYPLTCRTLPEPWYRGHELVSGLLVHRVEELDSDRRAERNAETC